MKKGNCLRCGIEYTYYFREKLCKECKLKPRPSKGVNRVYEHHHASMLWDEFIEAHPKLNWWPKEGHVMYKGGAHGWLTGLDDLGGPKEPVGIGFFRPKQSAHVTVYLERNPTTGKRYLRFETRCYVLTRRSKKAYKTWKKWLGDTEVCLCPGCLASRLLNALALEYYSDHITNEGD